MQIAGACRFVAGVSLLAVLTRFYLAPEGVSTAALVPVLDMLNHDSSSSVSQQYSPAVAKMSS